MPLIEIRVKDGGVIEADYEGFSDNMCDDAQYKLLEKLKQKGLELATSSEERKDNMLQEEKQLETA